MRPEDVLEVGVGVLDVVEGVHGGEGVLLVEGGEGGQSAIAEDVVVVEAAEDIVGIGAGPAGEAASDLVVEDEEPAVDPLVDDEEAEVDPRPGPSGRGRGRKPTAKDEMAQRLETAIEAFKADLFKSVNACARAHRVSPNTLGKMLKDPDMEYKGRGNVSKVFSQVEEERIAAHITERMLLGCGLDVWQVRMTQ